MSHAPDADSTPGSTGKNDLEGVTMTDLSQTENPPVALERRNRTWLWITIASAVVVAIAFGATSMLGKSVVYYRTTTEVSATPGQHVRLAGKLVAGSVVGDAGTGTTKFHLTDGSTDIAVVYTGSATTAITTASQPGTQLVAEGSLGTDGVFRSTVLLAKCPSKFQSGNGGNGNADA